MTTARRHRRFALVLCLLPAAYFLLVAAYALMNASDFASDLPRLTRYVLGPLVIALLLIGFGFLAGPDGALMVGITACSIMAGLFAFEAYMLTRALPGRIGLAGVVDPGVDLERFGSAFPPAYTIKGLNTGLGTPHLADAVLSGIPGAETLLCSQMGKPVTTRADSYGFRNPTPDTAAPIDIMVLGDSFGEGICLPDGQGLVDQMRAGGVSVLNTSSRGAGPLFELAVLGRYGPHFRPRVTVMAFFEGNDWDNLADERTRPWLVEALDPATDFGVIEVSPEKWERAEEVVANWWQGEAATTSEFLRRTAVLRNFLALQQTAAILGLHYPGGAHENPDYPVVLDRAKAIADGWQGRVVVVYIPSLDRFGGVFRHDFVTDPLRRMVATAAADAGLEFVDLVPAFRATGAPRKLYAPDSHLNAEGAALAAQTIMASPALALP